ncbi:PKD domain-containing protein [Haloarcula sp. 1CSR25-25]|uniref:PKD domain-containing protein n=1 Tax=Haloarcula sp. 1CSR25-25 TaxID=2862545 RepID=UPI0028957D30|nr:PKD domain-containing protein [Haloarcula sp. 1CSR25-25]MDT3436266.1 PKD domain-containing protein [Haloarcula sp. 1CSR25-25]
MKVPHLLSTDRAQSETVGVVLLTGVVVVITAVVGGIVLSGNGTNSQTPVVDIQGAATSQHVTVTHNGGDSLPRSDVDIVTDGNQRVRHSLDSYTQRVGADDTRFERGDSWRRSNAVTGNQLTLIAIHVPSNAVLDREQINVRVTSFARFTYDPQNPTPASTVDFDASDSEFEDGSIASYEWDFNNGDKTANGETATYSFPDNGDYPVTLTITADDGRTANRTETVTVYNQNPDVSFTYDPTEPGTDEEITFDGSGSDDPDGSIKSYEWDWTSDGTYEITGETVTHSYTGSGKKNVTLRVTDNDGASRRQTEVVPVGIRSSPTVSITETELSETGNSGKYDVSVTFEATDLDGDITNYTAILYDSSSRVTQLDKKTGSPYDGASTTVTLAEDGARTGDTVYVVGRVGDSTDRVGEDTQTVSVNNEDPTAKFAYSTENPDADQSISFDASGSSDPDADSLTYEWDWTSDGTYEATGEMQSHSYSQDGTYDVTLRVSDGLGGVATDTQTVVVGNGGSKPFYATVDGIQDNSQDCNRNPQGKCTNNDPTVQFEASWSASSSSGDIQNVTVELISPDGTTVDSEVYTYSGVADTSGTAALNHTPGQWDSEYTVRVTAFNITTSATDSRTEIADGA